MLIKLVDKSILFQLTKIGGLLCTGEYFLAAPF